MVFSKRIFTGSKCPFSSSRCRCMRSEIMRTVKKKTTNETPHVVAMVLVKKFVAPITKRTTTINKRVSGISTEPIRILPGTFHSRGDLSLKRRMATASV